MYPFPQSVNPAVSSHLDAQLAYFNKLSQTMSQSFQQVVQLNMQLSQTMLEEVANVGQRMLTAGRPVDVARATEETETSMRQQQETLKGKLQSSGDEADPDTGVQAAGQGGKVSAQGNMQGTPAHQPGARIPGQTR